MAKKKRVTSAKATPAVPEKSAEVSSLDIAAPLSATVQIQEVSLFETRLSMGSESSPGPDSGYIKIRIHDPLFGISHDPGDFWIIIPFSVIATRDQSSDSEQGRIFTLEASFKLFYHTDVLDSLDESIIEAFARTNGVYNAWPYWREFAQSMTSRMGLPPLTLPVFRLT